MWISLSTHIRRVNGRSPYVGTRINIDNHIRIIPTCRIIPRANILIDAYIRILVLFDINECVCL